MVKFLSFALILGVPLIWWYVSAKLQGYGLRKQSRPLKNDALEGLVNRLGSAAGVERVGVRVLQAPIINGMATPEGEIYVTEGLVAQVRNGKVTASEFASVVAHELGHLALGHTKRRAIDLAAAQAISVVVGGMLARLIPIIGWHLARAISTLFVATLSRKDEFEADAYATALMLRAGFGAEPQARMLEKLETLSPGSKQPDGPASWLASHPPVRDRAAAIRENAARWGASG
ncbi:MAG: M48 family metallopeptidase [Pseudomonadota bacterium]